MLLQGQLSHRIVHIFKIQTFRMPMEWKLLFLLLLINVQQEFWSAVVCLTCRRASAEKKYVQTTEAVYSTYVHILNQLLPAEHLLTVKEIAVSTP